MADMPPSEIGAVCRLCTKTTELLWVFNDKIKTSENFKDVIAITTGVEISIDDGPSQYVCKKCLECAIRMYQFRIKAQQSNKLVIEQYEERLKTPVAPPAPQPSQAVIHPSVSALIKIYPTINVPSSILKKNLSPTISLPMNFVEDYFRTRNLDMDEAVRSALRATRTKRSKNRPGPKSGKGEERKEKKRKPYLVSPINIKVDNDVPNYQIVKKPLEQNAEPPRVADKSDFAESLGLLPVNADQQAAKQESVKSKLQEKPPKTEKMKKKKEKKKTLLEQSIRLLDRVQQSLKRPGSGEPPHKKQKLADEAESNRGAPEQSAKTIGDADTSRNENDADDGGRSPPPSPPDFDGPIELAIEKQEQCHMCNVCNATEFDGRGLKRHMLRHMRCPFCKKKFKSLEATDEHIKQVCPISTCMKNLPDVSLVKVELDETLREKYPEAFADSFPPKEDSGKGGDAGPTGDVIEILSDDEDAASKKAEDVIEIVDNDKHATGMGSCSVITPTIGLRNSRYRNVPSNLSSRDSEQHILKALVSKSLRRSRDVSSCTQTFVSDGIVTNKPGTHIKLVGLKAQLHVTKIPLTIANGPFSLKLRDAQPQSNACPQMMRWDDLTPCDVADTTGYSPPSTLTASEKAAKRMVYDVPAKTPPPSTATATLVAPTYIPSSTATSTVFAPTYAPSVMLGSTDSSVSSVIDSVIVASLDRNPPVVSAAPAVVTTPIVRGQGLPMSAQARASPRSYAASHSRRPPPLVSLSSQPVATISPVTAASATNPGTAAAPKAIDTAKWPPRGETSHPKPAEGWNSARDKYKNGVQPPSSSYILPKVTSPSASMTRQIVLNSLIKLPPVDKNAVNSSATTDGGTQESTSYLINLKQMPNPDYRKKANTAPRSNALANALRVYRKNQTTNAAPNPLNGSSASNAGSTTSPKEVFWNFTSVPSTPDTPNSTASEVSGTPKGPTSSVMHPTASYQKTVGEAQKAPNPTVTHPATGIQKPVDESSIAPNSTPAAAFQEAVAEAPTAQVATVISELEEAIAEALRAQNSTADAEFQKAVAEAPMAPGPTVVGPEAGLKQAAAEAPTAPSSAATQPEAGFQKAAAGAPSSTLMPGGIRVKHVWELK